MDIECQPRSSICRRHKRSCRANSKPHRPQSEMGLLVTILNFLLSPPKYKNAPSSHPAPPSKRVYPPPKVNNPAQDYCVLKDLPNESRFSADTADTEPKTKKKARHRRRQSHSRKPSGHRSRSRTAHKRGFDVNDKNQEFCVERQDVHGAFQGRQGSSRPQPHAERKCTRQGEMSP